MRRSVFPLWRLFPVVLVIVFGLASVFSFGESPRLTDLADLISGSTSDSAGVLSSLEEKDLPVALAASEIVKFRALHGEIPLQVKDAEDFRIGVVKRLESANCVSLKKTDACSVSVAARSVELAGQKIEVPTYYTIPGGLVISSVSPEGEAGTLLPDIRVGFSANARLTTHEIAIDGQLLSPITMSKDTLFFRPSICSANALRIGTHTASILLRDAAGRVASRSWVFTVGVLPAPTVPTPRDMRDVGSFSLSLSFLDSASNNGETLLVSVSETPDGQRFVLYTVLRKDGKKLVESRSLFSLIRIVSKGVMRGIVGIRPRTPLAFVGNTLTYTCPLQAGDPGKITKQHWRVHDNGFGEYLNVDAPKIEWTMIPYMDIWVGVMLEVEYTADDGTTYVRYFYDEVYLRPIDAFISDAYPTRQFFLSDTGHEKMPVTVSRKLYSSGDNRELVEDDQFTFPEDSPGRLSVVRSRISVIPGVENAAIENLTATQTIVTFKGFGSIEFFNELVLTYDYNDEHYEKKFPPLRSIIWGVYPYKASVLYEKNPPGILLGTSRKFTCKQIDLSINGKNCSVTGQTGQLCEITPPQILATSTMFPNSQALFTNVMLPIMIRKSGDGLEQLPLFQKFQTTLSYDKSTFLENGGIPCRAYFIAGWSTKDGKLRGSPPIDWEMFNLLAHPMGDWFSVKAFPNPAALVKVEMEQPSQEIYEGQETELPVTILPLPGMGTGKLTSDGGVIDLLDGYETQKLNTLTWAAKLLPANSARESAKQAGPFQIAFKPVQGTGTYEIDASASLDVKEKDTGSTAVVTGNGSTEVVVKDGFKITSPTEGAMFPVGFPIRIATNLDNNPGEEWKKIQWTIAPSLPFSQPTVAPWYLYPVKADSWALTANYTTPDNQQLTSVVHFTTKPVDISISPVRRVCAFPGSSTIDVSVTVSINGQVVEKPNTPVQWGSDGSMALATVEWADITVPTKRGDFSHNSDSFTGQAAFISEGAMTVLATVTVAIQSKANKQGRDLGNTFTFPAVRADLWAVKNPMWSQPYAGDHPTQAISKSQRTFSFPSGNFVALGTDYSWGSDGLNPVMNLPPALNDGSVLAAKANQINFSWIRKGLPQAIGATYVARFDKPEIAELFLSSTLEFGRDGNVLFAQVRFPVAVTPLEDYVVATIVPQVILCP